MPRRCGTLFGHVIDECKSLGVSLWSCKFSHVQREGNKLAHALSRRAVLSANTDVWVESLPSDLDSEFNRIWFNKILSLFLKKKKKKKRKRKKKEKSLNILKNTRLKKCASCNSNTMYKFVLIYVCNCNFLCMRLYTSFNKNKAHLLKSNYI